MPIRVKLHGRIRTAAGSDEIELPSAVKSVSDLIEELMRKLGPDGDCYIFDPGTKEMRQSLVLLVNGHSVRMLEGLSTPLVEGDNVTVESIDFIEIVGGG
jgi:molybdopterin converting factor small subunit